ncbi:hypothetical protein BC2926_40910 [Bacillus cereus]|nr:hypothetical protein BC2926_40910 [Bacillus cereus]
MDMPYRLEIISVINKSKKYSYVGVRKSVSMERKNRAIKRIVGSIIFCNKLDCL